MTPRRPPVQAGGSGLVALVAALAAAGCISNETPPTDGLPAMCEVTSDCDQAAGEVCDQGVCWGDPPDSARFAAVLVPPAERADLPVTVLPELAIASDGGIAGIQFPDAVVVRGRVLLACPATDSPPYTCGSEASVGAQIRVERQSTFPGGPAYSRIVEAAAGIEPGKDAFSVLLPRDPDAEYRITILPDDSVGGESIAPGEIAPPRQITLRADQDREVEWVLGDPADLKVVRGCVQNVLGDGSDYADMRVLAFGRWTKLSPLERASSRSITGPDGCFELSVPRRMLDEFDITVQPGAGVALPTYTLRGEFVRDPAEGEQAVHTIDPPLLMPIAPAPVAYRLPLLVPSAAGGQEPVFGADVRLTTLFAPPAQEEGRDVEISFTAQAVTSGAESDEPGIADVMLYPGDESSRTYLVSVVPPAGSQVQTVFQREVAVGGAEVLEPLMLERRIAVRGRAVQQDGQPVVNAPMEARPSALFRLRLEPAALAQAVAELPVPTATTDGSGGFVLFLDSVLVGEAATYDIDVSPPPFSGAPSWSFEEVQVMRSDQGTQDLGKRALPEPSFARAVVLDQSGVAVPNAELHIYQLPPDDYCARQPAVAEGDCEPTAKLRGTPRSNEEGEVWVVLPDP